MDLNTYKKMTLADLKGRKVKTLVPMRNGWADIPAGTICEIEGKLNGFALKSDPCPHCGVSVHIGRVPARDVELLAGPMLESHGQ